MTTKRNRGVLRRLTLTHGGRTFLDRWGIVTRWGGFYFHHIADRDPGMDVHDHPWWFASIVLRGSYVEERSATQEACTRARKAEQYPDNFTPGDPSARRWLSVRRMPFDMAHRITSTSPGGAWTIVLRGPDRRVWGFYTPNGRVPWDHYDYDARRPLTVERDRRAS